MLRVGAVSRARGGEEARGYIPVCTYIYMYTVKATGCSCPSVPLRRCDVAERRSGTPFSASLVNGARIGWRHPLGAITEVNRPARAAPFIGSRNDFSQLGIPSRSSVLALGNKSVNTHRSFPLSRTDVFSQQISPTAKLPFKVKCHFWQSRLKLSCQSNI